MGMSPVSCFVYYDIGGGSLQKLGGRAFHLLCMSNKAGFGTGLVSIVAWVKKCSIIAPPLPPVDSKVFSTKQILAQFVPLEQATYALTDILVLSPSRKEDVPTGYKRLP